MASAAWMNGPNIQQVWAREPCLQRNKSYVLGLFTSSYKEVPSISEYATAIGEKSVPSIRITDSGSCAQPQEVQGEAVMASETYSSYMLRNTFFYLVIPSDFVKTYKLCGYASVIVKNRDAQYEFELRWGKV
nr:hypothetical protein [Tanacetum cinerariifolium]